jgi:hypothetical protein
VFQFYCQIVVIVLAGSFFDVLDLSGIDYTTVQADRYQQSWMGWAFAELYNEDGSVFTGMVSTVSRTYLFLLLPYQKDIEQFF